jgi:hypothetical protein
MMLHLFFLLAQILVCTAFVNLLQLSMVKKFFIIKKMFYFCFQTRSEENIRAPKIVSWVKG